MTLAGMAWRYLWSRWLVTLVALVGVMLGSALICSVLTLRRETQRTFLEEGSTFDLVIGAKGSPLQLVLSSIYHLDIPTGNIPLTRYEALKADERVLAAYPLALGDNFRGYRIIGTSPEFLTMKRRDTEGNYLPVFSMAKGRVFGKPFEAVLGSEVARAEGLGLGSTFVGAHGLVATPGSQTHAEFPYTVVGVLAPSGTSNDKAIFTPMQSVWDVHAHEEEVHFQLFAEEGDVAEEKPKEVTAVLVQLQSPGIRLWMADEIRKTTNEMAAIPVMEILRLYRQVLAPMERTLLVVAGIVVIVSCLTILGTLYQAAERRRRDLAILRALGARPRHVFALVMIEAVAITLIGVLAGWLLAHGGIALVAGTIRERVGIGVSAFGFDRQEAMALAVVAVVGILSGLVPAVQSYRRLPVNDLSAEG